MGRLLDVVAPVVGLLPEVQPPTERRGVSFRTKLFWTVVSLLVYLVCSQIPLYGNKQMGSDPFYIMRMILASSRGSLMELGISPIITSGMILQLLAGLKILDYDQNDKEDRQLFNAASKLLGILITLGEAVAYVLSGMYGPVGELGVFNAFALIAQLFFAGIIVILLDDLLSKGYGLGAGINIFIVANVCEGILWKCFSPQTINVGKGSEFEGAVVAFFHLLISRSNKARALWDAFFRPNMPNMSNLLATALIFLVVVYVQGFRFHVPVRHEKQRGVLKQYPMKLFYTSNMPIILLSSLVSNLYFFSQVLYRRYPSFLLVKLLGRWSDEGFGGARPVGGLSYYISPPQSFGDVVSDPFHALFYIAFMMTACALFAKTWIDISNTGARDVYKNFRQNEMVINGCRTEAEHMEYLNAKIPTAAAFGGVCVAGLTILADLLGAIGSGTGILMAVNIILELYEKVLQEHKHESKELMSSLLKAE